MKKTEINVLIVEDDKSLLEALSEGVKRLGYRAVAVAKPDEAESVVKIKPIHALIVDVMLPGKNGIDLVMRLKENLFDGALIIFTSGIYRDKAFAADALKKTGAVEYFLKPFDTEALLKFLDDKLKQYVDIPKIDLNSLLASPMSSERDRRKALDHVTDLTGYDLPFVLCILMDSKSSGHLNIVDDQQNISGITFCQGAISKVDSETTVLQTKKLLIQYGFITELELSELGAAGKSGDLVRALINEGLMSPHVPSIINTQTIVREISKLINGSKAEINFVPDRKLEPSPEQLDMAIFVHQLNDFIEKQVPVDYLKRFYKPWLTFPIRKGPSHQDLNQLQNLSVLKSAGGVVKGLTDEMTIEELIASQTASEEVIFRSVHLLMLRRAFIFKEAQRASNVEEHVNRVKVMSAALVGKNPFEIFQYFGLGNNPKSADVARIYKEFAKANHPDTLPVKVDPAVKKMNDELFSRVTAAYQILSNDDKRQEFVATLKQAEAEQQIKSDELVTAAASSLNKGRYSEGLQLLNKAEKLYSSERSRLHLIWARLKVDNQVQPNDLPAIESDLKGMATGTRSTGLWHYVMGLYRKRIGDMKAAQDYVRKALMIDEALMDARRELVNIKAAVPKSFSAEELLTGDLSTVLKGVFKKKKGA